MDAARAVVGRHSGPIYAVLKALGMENQATGYGRADLVAVSAVERVRRQFALLVDSAEAEGILGCTRAQLRRCAQSGIIRLFCRGLATSAPAYYRRDGVERLASVLMDGRPVVDAVPSTMIRLEAAYQLVRLKTDAALRAASEGRIKPRALLVVADGLRSIRNVLVDRDDLRGVAENSRPRRYSCVEAAHVLSRGLPWGR